MNQYAVVQRLFSGVDKLVLAALDLSKRGPNDLLVIGLTNRLNLVPLPRSILVLAFAIDLDTFNVVRTPLSWGWYPLGRLRLTGLWLRLRRWAG